MKGNVRIAGSIVFVILIIIALSLTITSRSGSEDSTLKFYSNQSYSSYSDEVNLLFEHVKSKMETLRGYKINTPVKIVNKKWVLEKFGSESTSKNELMNREIMYKALLLVPSEFRFEERKNREVESYMAFYWDHRIYVVSENFEPEDSSSGEALAHEVEHAIQDKFNMSSDGTFDGNMALNAIMEGDAVLAGWLYAEKNVNSMINKTINETSCTIEPIEGFDDNLHQLFYFPYLYGGTYMGKKYIEGGYNLVNEILENPPETTAEIIQGKKVDFEAVKINFSEIKKNTFNFTDFNVIRDDRLGEFFVYVFLSTHITDCRALESAKGWHGDRFILMRKGENYVFGWKIAFESIRDANEFESSLVELLNATGKKNGNIWESSYSSIEKITYNRQGRYISIYGFGKIDR